MSNKFKFESDSQDHVAEMFRNAQVEVKRVIDSDRKVCAEIVVNDSHTHRFAHTSRVSKALADSMTPDQLAERLNGGHYFFVDEHLVEWRDRQYPGFVHSDDTIQAFMNIIGVMDMQSMPAHRRASMERRVKRSSGDVAPLALRRVWADHEIEIPFYHEGGQFTSSIGFEWSPFTHFVSGTFDLVRQICSNGMVGTSNFMNIRVPVQNRWEEHMTIAATQLGNKVNDRVIHRIGAMSSERASLADCMTLMDHASARLGSADVTSMVEREHLNQIYHALNPREHLSDVYRESVFDNKALAAQQPSHLTRLDMYNVATELVTHYPETSDSSSFALHRMANNMLLPNEGNGSVDARKRALAGGRAQLAGFSDPDRAFFGDLS